MRHLRSSLVLLATLLFTSGAFAQGTSAQATATCDFDSSKQLVVEYQRIAVNSKKLVLGHEIPYNKVWAPGGGAMALFASSPVEVGGKNIPAGGYTMFVVPSENDWTLIISKATDRSGRYDEQDDLVRLPMQYGQLASPEDEFSVYFAHVAPDQCSMRVDLEKARAWVVFDKK